MKNLFHPSLYEFDRPQPSYWEASAPKPKLVNALLEGEQSCDVAIIGGGYTGLSAALHLARDYDVDVRLLEAGHIGWGASGRNGGFVTMGPTKLSLKTQFSRFGMEQTKAFYRCSAEAVELIRDLGREENIDYLPQGDGELHVADSFKHFDNLKQTAEAQTKYFGFETRLYNQDEFRDVGYDSPHQHGALLLKPSFALHPLRYAHGLAEVAERHGAIIHPYSKVESWTKSDGSHLLQTAGGKLRAKQVILTGNGFMPEFLHRGIQGRPLPLQSAIVVTRAMSPDELKQRRWYTENPAFNSKHMFYYYRQLSDGRFMLGARGNHIGDPAGAEKTWAGMKRSIAQMFPQFADLEYSHQWRGLVCFGLGLRPSIGRMPEDRSVYFAYGYHGNGVSTASWSGRELAKWLAGKESGDDLLPMHLPAIMRGRSPRFPLSFLRRQYLRAAIGVYKLRDYFDF